MNNPFAELREAWLKLLDGTAKQIGLYKLMDWLEKKLGGK